MLKQEAAVTEKLLTRQCMKKRDSDLAYDIIELFLKSQKNKKKLAVMQAVGEKC